MIKRFLKNSHHFLLFMQANLKNAMQLKLAFWLDIFGMALNNTAFVVIWIFFFLRVGTVNQWGVAEAIGLNGMVGTIYGITFAFAGGATTLATQVNNGNFDNFLISPVSLYVRILTSYSRTAAFGDILYGLVLLTIFAIMAHLPIGSILLLLAVIPLSAAIMINFVFVSGLISFLIPDTAEVAANFFELLVNPSLYPAGLYSGALRAFFLLVVPAIAIAGAPVELVTHPNVMLLLFLLILGILWTIAALVLLRMAIKKYDSGNLIGFKG